MPGLRNATRGRQARVASGSSWIRGCTRARGFTLIELMVVMAIIVILAGIGTALYTNSLTRSKEAVLKEDLFRMRDAIDQYYADKNKYPDSLEALVSEKYLRAVPVDPFTNSTDTWQTVMAEPNPSNPTADVGVFDVKSGAAQMALDGTAYSEW
jgi:general secretion pathway protein G